MSQLVRVAASVTTSASPERAFAELVDVEGQARWMIGTTIYPVDGDAPAPGVGSRLLAFTGVAHLGVLDTMLVTEYEQNSRWVVAHEGRVIRGSGIFTVTPTTSGGSITTWAEELELPFGLIGRLGWPVVKPAVGWGLRASLKSFGKLLESAR